jgi:hypothetical protein
MSRTLALVKNKRGTYTWANGGLILMAAMRIEGRWHLEDAHARGAPSGDDRRAGGGYVCADLRRHGLRPGVRARRILNGDYRGRCQMTDQNKDPSLVATEVADNDLDKVAGGDAKVPAASPKPTFTSILMDNGAGSAPPLAQIKS